LQTQIPLQLQYFQVKLNFLLLSSSSVFSAILAICHRGVGSTCVRLALADTRETRTCLHDFLRWFPIGVTAWYCAIRLRLCSWTNQETP
jgi:hypothetical protein